MPKIPKVFISYHHKREQKNKNKLVELFKKHHSEHFEIKDTSVGLDEIDINLLYKKLINKELNKGKLNKENIKKINKEFNKEKFNKENIKKINKELNKEFKKELYKKLNKEIFKIIREKYLKDSNVTILILGKHTKCRQHIDWEIATSLMSYGSLDRRKRNGLIILLTDDFIKKEKINSVFDGKNYNSLITEKNSGSRIYENVENNYASVESFSKMLSNPIKLKKMIDESLTNSKRVISPNTKTLLKDNNEEECQRKCLTIWTECFNFLFYDSKNQISKELSFKQIKKDEINTATQKEDEIIAELVFEQTKDEINEQIQSNSHRTPELLSGFFQLLVLFNSFTIITCF